VRYAFAPIELGESSVNLGEKHQALDGIINGRIRGEFPKGFDHPIARICCRHFDSIVAPIVFNAVEFFSESCLCFVGPTSGISRGAPFLTSAVGCMPC